MIVNKPPKGWSSWNTFGLDVNEQVMKEAASVLRRKDVMEGVADMISLLQVEAVFTDGSRLVSIHNPIK